MTPHRPLLALCAVATVTACAGLDTRLPEIDAQALAAETRAQEGVALRKMETQMRELVETGWPVLQANAQLCPKIRPAIGVKTHRLKSYPKRLREAAARELGVSDDPSIIHVVSNSPAARAGFRRGDIILNDAGEPARPIGDDWDEVLADNVVKIRRDGQTLDLKVEPVSACNYNLRLSASGAVNAYADGRNITFTTAMMDFVESENELALIIGHELAHNTMGHVRKAIVNYIVSLGGTRYTRPFESESDYVGLYYAVRAGYSAEGVEDFWKRLSAVSPKGINRAKTHPTFPDRYLRLAATRKEIAAKRASGAPLIPNFIREELVPSEG